MCSLLQPIANAAVLPEERLDLLYHSYEGDNTKIDGPAILVRKNFADKISIASHHLVDNVSGASIDVRVFGASAYREKRTEQSLSFNLLQDKTQYVFGYEQSNENDFDAKGAFISISQDFFGDLTNITLGYSRGWDTVGMSTDANFSEDVERDSFSIKISQILTPKAILFANMETISDEGFLNNPYRSVRFIDPSVSRGWSLQPEVYPNTRTSNAFSISGLYYLDYGASLGGSIRYFNDTWDISAQTLELKYKQRIQTFTIGARIRFHQQNEASFYSDLFPFRDAQNFLARDKELSDLSSIMLGFSISYALKTEQTRWINKVEASLAYDRYQIDYNNFRNAEIVSVTAGTEPLFSLNADLIRFYFTAWY